MVEPARYSPLRPVPGDPSAALELTLRVEDREMAVDLLDVPEGRARDQFALHALRIGLLALRQARGQVDAEAVRREGERILVDLRARLAEHDRGLESKLQTTLKEYFDPHSGRLSERLERLLQKDGELEGALRRVVGATDSDLVRTLSAAVGQESPLMRMLSPTQSDGILRALTESVDRALAAQRDGLLAEFSLDKPESALSRLVREMSDKTQGLGGDLTGRIDLLVREFSLNVADSALARMREELLGVLEKQAKAGAEFQQEVRATLAGMAARKAEAALSTRHGLAFEAALWEVLRDRAQRAGDLAAHVAGETGEVRGQKVGDVVVTLGPDKAAAGARIVVEAKDVASYDLRQAREEIETARKNRAAQVGVFVFSRQNAPAGLDGLQRFGDDVFTSWDEDDPTTDVTLSAAMSVAVALCTRAAVAREAVAADLGALDRAVHEVERQAQALEEVRTSAETIRSGSGKILERVRIVREGLERQVESLRAGLSAFRT